MKKILSVTMHKSTGDQTMEVGAFLMNADEKTKSDIFVSRIIIIFKTVRVYFSDGRMFLFKGLPFTIIKK